MFPIPTEHENRPEFDENYILNATRQDDDKTLPRLKVAAYIRVSTDLQDQENSYAVQEQYFQQIIESNPLWKLVGIYSDYGISGTSKEKRVGFCRLIRHCQEGKINRILCKSISRFARNTADFSSALFLLRNCQVTVFFEKENLDSAELKNEFILSVLGAFAQEESENARWLTKMAIQQKYRKGHPMRQLHRCLGYQKDQAGNLVPDKNAELVRQIFQMAADGWSISQITKYLNENKITTQNDRIFSRSTVSRILHNHAYKGDYICQRYYVNNQRKLVRNKGEKQMYYIRHDHLAIVSEEMWETAQEKLAKKSERNRQGLPSDEIAVTKKAQVPDAPEKRPPKEKIPQKEKSGLIPDKPPLTLANYPYKDRIFCKYCGSRLRRIIARNHSVWWICNGLSRKGKAFCKGVRIPDEKLSPLRNISFSAYIGKELIDGKETYGYSSKPDEWKR